MGREAVVVATHLDAINHMALSREALKKYVDEEGISERVRIPEDGAALEL